MGLNVTKFLRMKPHLPFRFKTIWYTGFHDGQDQYLTYAVQSVTLPKYDIDNAAGYSNFGNVRMYVPIYSPGVRKLEITFEETNHLYVTAFLHKLLEESYSREPYQITIVLQEFDEHMKREKTKGYVCHLSSYEEPSFKRDGSAQQITVNATFLVDTVINPWSSDAIVTGKRQRTYDSQFNQGYDELKVDKENTEFTFGKTDFGSNPDYPSSGGKSLSEFTSKNINREENYKQLLARMRGANVNLNDTTQVVNFLSKEGYIKPDGKQAGGLCATSTYLLAAITSGQESLGKTAGHGKNQDLSAYGYSKVAEGSSLNDLNKMIKNGQLKEGDVINISYKDGAKHSEYGHAVTVIKKEDGTLGFASDFIQKTAHGISADIFNTFYVQRRGN